MADSHSNTTNPCLAERLGGNASRPRASVLGLFLSEHKYKKFWMIAMCAAALMIVSTIPASADTSKVVWFKVKNNMRCVENGEYSNYILKISNLESSPATVNVQLYKNDGTEFTTSGAGSGSGYSTTFTPGTAFTLSAKASAQYLVNFGYTFNPFADRPAYGKITVQDDAGLLIAKGESRAAKTSSETIHDVPIIINNGQPF